MIVILSLTLPAATAGGLGGDERPEDPVPTPEDGLQQVLDLLWSLGAIQGIPVTLPDTHGVPGTELLPVPQPPAPSEDDDGSPPAEEDEEGQGEDEGDGGGGGTGTTDPTRYIPCAVDAPERDHCGESPEEDAPEAPQPEPGQTAPTAPDLQRLPERRDDLPVQLPVDEPDDTSLLNTILAPVQAVAKSASEGAKAMVSGVVTTAGFVAQEATHQTTQVAALAGGVLNWAAGALLEILTPDTGATVQGDGDGLQTQSADVGVVERPVSIVTLGLIAMGGLGLIAVAFSGVRKLLGFGGAALLSRIPSKDIMKNDTRAQIFEIVQSDPGVSLNEIVDRLGLSRNAIAYHLAVFESEKQVVSVKDGKYRRYFVNGGKYVNGAKDVVSTIKNDVTRNVIRFILEHPGAMQKEVCTAVGTSPSATNWHITRLEKVGLVEKEKVANTVRYSPGPSFTKYDLGEFGLASAPMA